MAKDKLILDIRFFESDNRIATGMSPRRLGKIFDVSSGQTGDRVARKLRELGFTTGGAFDHLYINFTTALSPGEMALSDRVLPRRRYLEFGGDPKFVNRLSAKKRTQWLIDATFSAVEFIANGDENKKNIISVVRELVAQDGENMTFIHKVKDTKSFTVTVSYTIATFGAKDRRGKKLRSTACVEYTDKRTAESRRGVFAELEHYEDLFFLVSSVSVKAGAITFRPRASCKAQFYNKRYAVPLTVDIADLDIA